MVIQIGEMDNKGNRSRKNKSIKKKNKASLKTTKREQNQQQQLVNDNMVDLISEQHQSRQQQNDNEQMVEEGEEEMNRNSQTNQSSARVLELSKQKIVFVLKSGQHYKLKIQHEQINKIMIAPFFKTQQLQINGKSYTSYQPIQQFILIINKNENINKKAEELKQLPKELAKSIDLATQTLVLANRSLVIQECEEPWQNLPKCTEGNDSVLIVGMKNSGKSSLSEYLLHQRQKETILLDCDIGRNCALEGCISLNTSGFTKKIWIGELTPLNNLQTYVRAVKYFFKYYEEHYFTKKLIVNTMGYTTGLGQFLLYQIYQIIKPKSIIVLQSQPVTKYDGMSRIIRTIKKGEYVEKLFISKQSERVYPTSTTVFYYENSHATSKKTTSRFEKAFECGSKKINHVTDLFALLNYSRTYKAHAEESLKVIERSRVSIFQQSRHKKEDLEGIQMVSFRKLQDNQSIDMRLVALGKMVIDELNESQTGLFEVEGLGFCYGGFIFSKFQMEGMVGVVSEGIDFEKGFYHLNEKQLIDLQLSMGRVNYMMVMTKGLGTKGMRNNPSKVQ